MPSTITLQPGAKALIPTFYCKILQEIYYFYWIIVLSDPTLPSVLFGKGVGTVRDILIHTTISHKEEANEQGKVTVFKQIQCSGKTKPQSSLQNFNNLLFADTQIENTG